MFCLQMSSLDTVEEHVLAAIKRAGRPVTESDVIAATLLPAGLVSQAIGTLLYKQLIMPAISPNGKKHGDEEESLQVVGAAI